MSGAVQTPAAPVRVWPMYRALVGVGLACGLLIVGVYEGTRPVIERAKAEALQRAILTVLPGTASSRPFVEGGDGGFVPLDGDPAGAPVVHVGFDDAGALVGVAIEAEGMGYQDVIRVIYGYAPDRDGIVGIQVLESKETPGLGDKIETDPDFLANFERLEVSLADDGETLANPIVAVKSGEKQHPWQVDGITGATISSVAIANILDRSASYWVPRIRRGIDDFRPGEQEGP